MHILLTDIATCPRCGPDFGLILLVHEAVERNVVRGALACANCRENYPIHDGIADFRQGLAPDWGAAIPEGSVQRLVALAGVTSGPGYLLVAGPAAAHADAIGSWLPEVEQLVATSHTDAAEPATHRIATAESLPFRNAVLAGAILTGGAADALLEETARALMLVGRLVVQPIPPNAATRLAAAGLRVVAEDGATLVATRR